jgi:hypothetical protein
VVKQVRKCMHRIIVMALCSVVASRVPIRADLKISEFLLCAMKMRAGGGGKYVSQGHQRGRYRPVSYKLIIQYFAIKIV